MGSGQRRSRRTRVRSGCPKSPARSKRRHHCPRTSRPLTAPTRPRPPARRRLEPHQRSVAPGAGSARWPTSLPRMRQRRNRRRLSPACDRTSRTGCPRKPSRRWPAVSEHRRWPPCHSRRSAPELRQRFQDQTASPAPCLAAICSGSDQSAGPAPASQRSCARMGR